MSMITSGQIQSHPQKTLAEMPCTEPEDHKLLSAIVRRSQLLEKKEQEILNAYDLATEETRSIVDFALGITQSKRMA